MTDIASVSPLVPRANPVRQVRAEVLDGITEVLISLPDPVDRGAAICRLVGEMYDSVSWLRSADVADEEVASLRQLVAAAEAHQVRVSTAAGLGSPVTHHEPPPRVRTPDATAWALRQRTD